MKFLVKTPLSHNGKDYAPGSMVELDEAAAAAMPWAVEPAPEKKPAGDGDGKGDGKGKSKE